MTVPESTGASAALGRLADEAWDGSMAAQPTFATSIGDARFDDRLPDHSPGADAAERRRLSDLLVRAQALPVSGLSGPDATTREALVAYLEMELDLVLAGVDRWTVDPLEGPQVHFLNLSSFQPLENPTEGRRLIARWRAMEAYLDQSIANLVEGLDHGLVSPEAPIRAVLDELDDLLASPLAESPLMAPAATERAAWSPAERAAFDAELESVVGERIQPAFGRYRLALLERVLPRGRSNERPGLGEVPGGDEAYGRLVRAHTSLDQSPSAIHATGLAEVERIDAELEELTGRALGTRDRAAAIGRLRTDAELRFASGAEILATAEGALARANAAVPDWFGRLPTAACEVVEMGAHESKHSTIAYYLQPAEDGRRPGRYYLNTSAPETRPRYEAEALAFHEAVPGHHLQLATAQDLRELPAFRRHAGSTAFFEGWGLYSERLSDEMGLYSSDLDRIGIASFDGWRACRLVVDTGIHAQGWSRDRAIEFMLEHTALAPDNIVNEVDRYITWPGQALAYKLGQLEIHRLREDARARLGAGFEIRAFHDAILAQGALPLSLLATTVESTLLTR